jgi:hypothetical protein
MNETASSATVGGPARPSRESAVSRVTAAALLGLAAVFFLLHWLHLSADFPNHSPWVDWSKYTDEGWYGDAAIRHYLTGHWYWKGDFNPAVALPVWPALELVWFKFTGVSPAAARALTLVVFAVTLVALYRLMERHTRAHSTHSGPPLAAPLTMLLLCVSPLLYVFERMAILEPLLIALTVLALLAASHLHPVGKGKLAAILPSVALSLLLPAMVLTKTTAICLLPAIFYMVWARAGYRIGPALRLGVPPAVAGVGLWCGYYFLFVRPRYLADYQYLFSANAYTGIELEPLAKVVLNTLGDAAWMGKPVYTLFYVVVVLVFFWRPRLLNNPLLPALLLWIAGYFAFLAYHNNLQPRYYIVIAVPITAVVALGLDGLRQARTEALRWAGLGVAAAAALAIAVPDAVQEIGFALHPTYDFKNAAAAIKGIVLADRQHSDLILSISGSDLTLMTGLPSIDDDFGTLELPDRVKQYRPGWYVAWNEVDDDKADSLTPYYRIVRVAEFPVYDDSDRNLLILYRLDAAAPVQPPERPRRHTPKPLITRLGQQPSVNQLVH